MQEFVFLAGDSLANASEDAHQAALVQWAGWEQRRQPGLAMLFAVPNGGQRSIRTGRLLKRTGVRAGVPDLCLALPAGPYHGLWIELKKPGGRVAAAQALWIERLRLVGYAAVVCYGADAAIRALKWYLAMASAQTR